MNEIAISGVADADAIRARILTIRGVQVMLDRDLALFYGVPTKRLNEQVKRNRDRFPARFMFRLACEEVASLRSQIATSNGGAEFGTTALRSQLATLKRPGRSRTRSLPCAVRSLPSRPFSPASKKRSGSRPLPHSRWNGTVSLRRVPQGPRPPILRRHENGRAVHSVHSPKDLRETNSRQPVSSSSRRPRCKRHFLSIRS